MNLRRLRSFVTIVDAGSINRAAALIHVAQPALTVQIRQLEEEFGVQLLIRSHGGATPSPAGRELYREAVRLLAIADSLPARIGACSGELEGLVTLAYPLGLNPALLGSTLIRMRERHPRVRLRVVTVDSAAIQKSVYDGDADLGVSLDPQTMVGLIFRTLAVEPVLLCGPDPDHALRRVMRADTTVQVGSKHGRIPTVRFADVLKLPLLLPSRSCGLRRDLEEACTAAGGELRIVHEQDSAVAIDALCSFGEGFYFCSPGTLLSQRPDRPVILARVTEPDLERTISLTWASANTLSPAARSVIEVLRTEAAGPVTQPDPDLIRIPESEPESHCT